MVHVTTDKDGLISGFYKSTVGAEHRAARNSGALGDRTLPLNLKIAVEVNVGASWRGEAFLAPPDRAIFAECMRDYALATLFKAQLRRRRDPRQENADGAVDFACLFARGGVDGDYPLPRMSRQPRDARLEERT